MPQSHPLDQPTAPLGSDTQHQQPNNSNNTIQVLILSKLIAKTRAVT